MLDGVFVTICGMSRYKEMSPFAIGESFICVKEPSIYDEDAIKVVDAIGETVGYLANRADTKAGGTLMASRVYDKVGDSFSVEVCFTTRTKVICRITDFDLKPEEK